MAKKIEIINNALVITDTDTSIVIADTPKRLVYYDVEFLERDMILITQINATEYSTRNIPAIPLAEAVNSASLAYTKESFLTFARTNLGA